MPTHKTLLVIVQAATPSLLAYTLDHANAFAEEVALRGVLARVWTRNNPAARPLPLVVACAREALDLHKRGALTTVHDGVMLLRADYRDRDLYDTVGASDMWRSTHGTATILSHTEGGPTRENGYLYLAPTTALLRGAWTLPGVSPMWLAIRPDRAERGDAKCAS